VNIDERLDRLTTRHEALTQTVEILTHDVSTLRDTMNTMNASLATLRDTVREQNTGIMSILQGILDVVRSHENRLGRLENGGSGTT